MGEAPRPRGMCRIQEKMQTDSDPWSCGDTEWDTGGIERVSHPERVAFWAAKNEGPLPPFRVEPSDLRWGGMVFEAYLCFWGVPLRGHPSRSHPVFPVSSLNVRRGRFGRRGLGSRRTFSIRPSPVNARSSTSISGFATACRTNRLSSAAGIGSARTFFAFTPGMPVACYSRYRSAFSASLTFCRSASP